VKTEYYKNGELELERGTKESTSSFYIRRRRVRIIEERIN